MAYKHSNFTKKKKKISWFLYPCVTTFKISLIYMSKVVRKEISKKYAKLC